jgi:hypothetical protein
MLKFAQAGALAGAGLVLALCAVGWLSPDAPRAASRLQLVEVPMRRFAFRNPNGAVAAPRRLRIAPFQALYSASLGEDPQSFLQKAPEQGKPGLFRSYMPPLRGEAGGTPEYKVGANPELLCVIFLRVCVFWPRFLVLKIAPGCSTRKRCRSARALGSLACASTS